MNSNCFFDFTKFELYKPSALRLQSWAFVPRFGFVFSRGIPFFRTIYSNKVVVLKYFFLSLFSYFKRKLVVVDYSDKPYAVVHSVWSAGYYHWITESLPRVLVAKRDFPNCIVMLPTSKYLNYIESLKLLGCHEFYVYPEGVNVYVNSPVITDCPPRFGTTDPYLLGFVRDSIIKSLNLTLSKDPRKVVYVSRRLARGRKVINESILTDRLISIGVEVICFESLSFSEQVVLMSETKCLVSIHGAALTNMLFMPEGGSVIELVPIKHGFFDFNYVRRSFAHDGCYIRLAHSLGFKYSAVSCEALSKFYQKTHMADLNLGDKEIDLIVSLINESTCVEKD